MTDEGLLELGGGSREIFAQNVDRYLERMNKTIFRRAQKEAYECSAKCCEAPFTKGREFHDCTEVCAARSNDIRDYTETVINKHRASLENCVLSCRKEGREMEKTGKFRDAIGMFDDCSEKCVQDHTFRLTQIVEDIIKHIEESFIILNSPSISD